MNINTDPDKIHNPLEVMSPGERTIMEIKRHPFGLIGAYITGALIILALIVAAALIPHYMTDISKQDKAAILAGALVLAAIVLLYVYVLAIIYKGNRWIVTSDSITQVSQTGLFRKHTSQLSLANLEDVTFEQDSVVQSMFGFGTLRVETAGERSKFLFPFCPKPADCAKSIIQAHEQFINAHPEEQHSAQVALNTAPGYMSPGYPQPPQPPAPPSAPAGPASVPAAPQSPQPSMGYTVPTEPEDVGEEQGKPE